MLDLLSEKELPGGFTYPDAFMRAAESGLISLEPWWLLEGDRLRVRISGLRERFPERQLVPFARREDNDDVACWDVGSGKVCIIHDFTTPGREQRAEYPHFYDWLRSAVEDFIQHD
ncbi:hypothetical protein [Streptomyces buecherae]|uniref:hypothetical protein n=1 Tax=Streptomyces buecherae TaxID=2763006 RepID=UPI001C27BCA3|nr:hypothetical protein [Streptomyces buecherae]